jgi:hypothetical protein
MLETFLAILAIALVANWTICRTKIQLQEDVVVALTCFAYGILFHFNFQ